ncbi:hypothetical protein DL93DRAFT_2122978 [Clavulina sp. PMI_390]|nr:hypothetical protein DL93DRAFT_2122978 [Clavulina sp. PMI_390]
MRALASKLRVMGVPAKTVPEVIEATAESLGVSLQGSISRQTVARAVQERGIVCEVQLAFETQRATSGTLSGDGTSNRNINFQSLHMTMPVPSYSISATSNSSSSMTPAPAIGPSSDSPSVRAQRFLGIHATAAKTATAQLENIQLTFGAIEKAAHIVPRLGPWFGIDVEQARTHRDFQNLARKLTGYMSDHAEDQMKLTRLLEKWVHRQTLSHLGTLLLDSWPEDEYKKFCDGVSQSAGASGERGEVRETDDDSERIQRTRDAFIDAVHALGLGVYEKMESAERRELDLFVRAGCGMHKDLNAVKGGNTAMMSIWSELGAQPIALPNKFQAARTPKINAAPKASSTSGSSELKGPERGAIKLCSLAGALFNNKDDKKGEQDSHVAYFSLQFGSSKRFPDTSNTRYGSYIAAASELFTKRRSYVSYLTHLGRKKTLNNMESNIQLALADAPTIVELATLALYGQAISIPYMRAIRSKDQNMLRLGPLHDRVKAHLKLLIESPSFLLDELASATFGALDGDEWDNPEVFVALKQEVQGGTLNEDHLVSALRAFLQGALDTWDRFTAEFRDGAVIAGLSDAELEAAFMPTTNDANEGKLGMYRVWVRRFPRMTNAMFNAIAMSKTNNVEAFIEAVMEPDDWGYIMKEQRRREGQNEQKQSRDAIVRADIEKGVETEQQQKIKKDKKSQKSSELSALPWILDDVVIEQLVGKDLDAQVSKHRELGKDEALVRGKARNNKLATWSSLKTVHDKRRFLIGVVARFKERGEQIGLEDLQEAQESIVLENDFHASDDEFDEYFP